MTERTISTWAGLALALTLTSACAPADLGPVQNNTSSNNATNNATNNANNTNNTGGSNNAGGNPFACDDTAATEGKMLYDGNGCATCHGDDGRSTSFKDLAISASGDPQVIFDAIRDGVPNTAMVSYSSTFEDDEIWKITTWVQTLGDSCDGGGGGGTNNGGGDMTNPFAGDAAEAAAGKIVYDDNGCTACHGTDGKSTSFKDLSAADDTSDTILFLAIDEGVPNTAMVSYGEVIEDDDIWRIVTWIRTIE